MKITIVLILLGVIMASCTTRYYNSKHFVNGKFINEETIYNSSLSQILSILYDFIFHKSKEAIPKKNIPVINLTTKDIEELEDYSVIRFAHSSPLYKFEEKLILTDPVFGERVSPLSFIGPKKFHKMPISIEELPFIDFVIISHNHYDHLDEYSIRKLKNKVGKFYTTLGIGEKLQEFGVKKENIIELNWWESKIDNRIEFICTPAQHFSGRGLLDRDKTLWSSWVIKTSKAKIYFGADGGYFNGFKEIAKKYAPFDMSFLEVGAYNEKWKEIHMMPYESIQAHIDLNAKVMFPIHNGSFDLALHSWFEPFEKVDIEAIKKDIAIIYPKMGEAISILRENQTIKWWKVN